MGRNKSSAIEDIMVIISKLPWWVGVALALVSYIWLHSIASAASVPVPSTGPKAAALSHTIWQGLAGVFQYFLPLICLIGAGISALKKKDDSN